MKWTEKKGGALDRVQSSRIPRLTKLTNLFLFLMSNKLVNNTPEHMCMKKDIFRLQRERLAS